MTKIGLLGDTHGNRAWLRFALWNFHHHGIDRIVQLGDFGIWPGQESARTMKTVRLLAERFGQTLYVIPGNHEDYDQINAVEVSDDGWQYFRKNILLAPRGHRWAWEDTSFVALGGAPSVDRSWRLQQKSPKSWWEEEAITQKDVNSVIAGGYADVMLTHDAPGCQSIMDRIKGNPQGFKQEDLEYAAEGRKLMERAFQGVAPKILIHGHYHFPVLDKLTVIRDRGREEALILGLDCDQAARSMGSLDTETGSADLWDVREDYQRYLSSGTL